jgi:alpha-tubulin suppressor-like RCC1 family protein
VRIKLENIDSFAAGENHSLFVVEGKVYACGDNSNGQLGALFNKKFSSEAIKYKINHVEYNFKTMNPLSVSTPKNTP